MTPQLFDERGFGSLEIETDEDREVAASVDAETNSDPTAEVDAGDRYSSGRDGKEHMRSEFGRQEYPPSKLRELPEKLGQDFFPGALCIDKAAIRKRAIAGGKDKHVPALPIKL